MYNRDYYIFVCILSLRLNIKINNFVNFVLIPFKIEPPTLNFYIKY